MLIVTAEFPIDPDKRDEALGLIQETAEQSRNEDGVIGYEIAIDIDNPNLFRLTEQYEDETAFEAHGESEHVGDLVAALPDLLAGEPDITRFDVKSKSDVEL